MIRRLRAFPVVGPTVWNSLPDELKDPACERLILTICAM